MQDVHCKCIINEHKGGRLADTPRQSCLIIRFCKCLPHGRLLSLLFENARLMKMRVRIMYPLL